MVHAIRRKAAPNTWIAFMLIGMLSLLLAPALTGQPHKVELGGARISAEQGVHAAGTGKPANEPKVVPLALGGLGAAAWMGRFRRDLAKHGRVGSDAIAILLRHRLLAPIQMTSVYVDNPSLFCAARSQ
ncbi:hypothetical protein ACFFSY_11390 [Paenibacillus aurantiacus]|uniref:Uncharacterized protein n=1 Tax=Paenibacillus aurantiacus TaxID=1936118 RepID=A0ABV5KMS8_9BACL